MFNAPTIRRISTWIAVGLTGAVIFGVVAEWFIKVAEDKGWYKDAGKTWDSLVTILTSALAVDFAIATLFLSLGMWLNFVLSRRDGTPPEDDKPENEIAPNPEIEAANSRIESLEAQLDAINQREETKKQVEERLDKISNLEATFKECLPMCNSAADQLQSKFLTIMSDLEKAAGWQFTSSSDMPIRELDLALSDWEGAIHCLQGLTEFSRLPGDSVFDYSAYSKDPLRTALNEPSGLSPDIQSRYRKFAAQRDNVAAIERDAPTALAEEKKKLLAELNS